MAFILKLNLQEKKHEALRKKVLAQNKDLEVSYSISYSTKSGGIGQSYVWSETENGARKKAKTQAELHGGKLISINKTVDVYYNNKTKSLKEIK